MPNGFHAARIAAPGLFSSCLERGAAGPEQPARFLAEELAQYLRFQRYEEVAVDCSGEACQVLGYPSGSAVLCEVSITEAAVPQQRGLRGPELEVSAAARRAGYCAARRPEDLKAISDLHAARVFGFLARLDGVELHPAARPPRVI